MKVKDLIKQLENYPEFEIEAHIQTKISDELLKDSPYRYPYEYTRCQLEVSDIGHSNKTISITVF